MKLFDYIKVLFGKDSEWDEISDYDKSRNAFMTNRFMSAKFPIQANLFNQLRTDPVGQAAAWRMVSSKFNKVPGFIYTKIKKEKEEKEWKPNDKALGIYLKLNEIGEREFYEALKYNFSEVKKSIEALEKQIGKDDN
jgi:hypothetical protein